MAEQRDGWTKLDIIALEARGFNVPEIQKLDVGPDKTQLKYFRKDDEGGALDIVKLLQEQGMIDVKATLVSGYENSTAMRPKHYELWFSPNSLRSGGEAVSQ